MRDKTIVFDEFTLQMLSKHSQMLHALSAFTRAEVTHDDVRKAQEEFAEARGVLRKHYEEALQCK